MLTRWTLENFKPIRARLDLPLAPLTVLAGLNSSGKSSLLQSILLVAQTLANPRTDEPLILNGPFVRLGTFAEVLNERAEQPWIRIGYEIRIVQGLPASISINARFEGLSGKEEIATGLQAARARLCEVDMELGASGGEIPGAWRVVIRPANEEEVRELSETQTPPSPDGQNYIVAFSEPTGGFKSFVSMAHFIPVGWTGSLGKGFEVSKLPKPPFLPAALESQVVSFHTFTSAIRYLGPLRAEPHAVQSFSPSGQPDDVGPRGEYAAAVYASNRQQSITFWNPDSKQVETATLEQAMGIWLRYLGIADQVSAREAAAPGVAWSVRSTPTSHERPLHAVGVGVSQVLPILVSGLLTAPGTILIMEQPELHLHERPQARLGDFFYGLTLVGKQVLVETHSAVLINQLRLLMLKGGQSARDVIAIYFVEQDEHGDAQFKPIRISPRGAIENWPDGFFDESFRQEEQITQEGIRARGRRKHA